MKTNLKIRLESGEMEMPCRRIPLHSTFVNIKKLISDQQEAVLFEKRHAALQTQFDLSESGVCWLLTFDANKEFVSAKPNYYQGAAPFSVFIPEPYVLVLEGNIPFERICSFVYSPGREEVQND